MIVLKTGQTQKRHAMSQAVASGLLELGNFATQLVEVARSSGV